MVVGTIGLWNFSHPPESIALLSEIVPFGLRVSLILVTPFCFSPGYVTFGEKAQHVRMVQSLRRSAMALVATAIAVSDVPLSKSRSIQKNRAVVSLKARVPFL